MFYNINKASSLKFRSVLKDIQTLNKSATLGKYDVSAISLFAYPLCFIHYQILKCGASVGYRYGPLLVSRRKFHICDMKNLVVAVPGRLTTSYALLKIFCPEAKTVSMRFDKIISAIKCNQVDAGLLIHDAQVRYRDEGLYKIIDLGKWWWEKFSLPIVLGVVVVKRKLSEELKRKIKLAIKASIRYSFKNYSEAINFSARYYRGKNLLGLRKFVKMYVNNFTYNLEPICIKSIKIFFNKAYNLGILHQKVLPEFI